MSDPKGQRESGFLSGVKLVLVHEVGDYQAKSWENIV